MRNLWPQLSARFVVDDSSGCWLWTGTLDNDGYGLFQGIEHKTIRRTRKAHRLVYEHVVGPIPEGLSLDHLCRVRRCVNPAHLEPVTRGENVRRGTGPVQVYERLRSQTHCLRGHELAGDNLYLVPKTGARRCRECQRIRGRIYDAKRARRRKVA